MTELEFKIEVVRLFFAELNGRKPEREVPNYLLTEFKLLTELKLKAEFLSHRDTRRLVDPAMGNSFGSYAEPGTRILSSRSFVHGTR